MLFSRACAGREERAEMIEASRLCAALPMPSRRAALMNMMSLASKASARRRRYGARCRAARRVVYARRAATIAHYIAIFPSR